MCGPLLAGIAPSNYRRVQATHKIACQAMDNTNHPLYGTLSSQLHSGRQQLVSRRPFSRHAMALVNTGFNINTAWCNDWKEVPRWGLKTSPSCICSAEPQTAEHIIFNCRVLHPPIGQEDLETPDEEGKKWLQLVAEYT
ncbi:unnamed protein product [Clavelina lepadiformis]|uniref:Reverse transcriptase n=1 Tax=Clavelina lepadiformis TaxID=159417 RepID=A0ABP0FX92_CLALP